MFKLIFFAIVAAVLCASAFALSPPAPTVYSQQSIEILNIVSHCPGEFGELAKYGQISHAESQIDSLGTHYSLLFMTPGFAPSNHPTRAGELRILTKFVESKNSHPESPGGTYEYACSIVK